jgi:hypothetical protein
MASVFLLEIPAPWFIKNDLPGTKKCFLQHIKQHQTIKKIWDFQMFHGVLLNHPEKMHHTFKCPPPVWSRRSLPCPWLLLSAPGRPKTSARPSRYHGTSATPCFTNMEKKHEKKP